MEQQIQEEEYNLEDLAEIIDEDEQREKLQESLDEFASFADEFERQVN